MFLYIVCLPPRYTLHCTLFPYTTLVRTGERPEAPYGDLADEDDERGDDMEPLDAVHEHQHQDHGGDHDLVGDRIQDDAEPRHRPLGAGEIAVEIAGDAHQAVEREVERIVESHDHRPQPRHPTRTRAAPHPGEERRK